MAARIRVVAGIVFALGTVLLNAEQASAQVTIAIDQPLAATTFEPTDAISATGTSNLTTGNVTVRIVDLQMNVYGTPQTSGVDPNTGNWAAQLQPPSGGWPVGYIRIQVLYNGQVYDQRTLEIVDGGGCAEC